QASRSRREPRTNDGSGADLGNTSLGDVEGVLHEAVVQMKADRRLQPPGTPGQPRQPDTQYDQGHEGPRVIGVQGQVHDGEYSDTEVPRASRGWGSYSTVIRAPHVRIAGQGELAKPSTTPVPESFPSEPTACMVRPRRVISSAAAWNGTMHKMTAVAATKNSVP